MNSMITDPSTTCYPTEMVSVAYLRQRTRSLEYQIWHQLPLWKEWATRLDENEMWYVNLFEYLLPAKITEVGPPICMANIGDEKLTLYLKWSKEDYGYFMKHQNYVQSFGNKLHNYIDDFVLWGRKKKKNIINKRNQKKLEDRKIILHPSKCALGQSEIKLFGFILNKEVDLY